MGIKQARTVCGAALAHDACLDVCEAVVSAVNVIRSLGLGALCLIDIAAAPAASCWMAVSGDMIRRPLPHAGEAWSPSSALHAAGSLIGNSRTSTTSSRSCTASHGTHIGHGIQLEVCRGRGGRRLFHFRCLRLLLLLLRRRLLRGVAAAVVRQVVQPVQAVDPLCIGRPTTTGVALLRAS